MYFAQLVLNFIYNFAFFSSLTEKFERFFISINKETNLDSVNEKYY